MMIAPAPGAVVGPIGGGGGGDDPNDGDRDKDKDPLGTSPGGAPTS